MERRAFSSITGDPTLNKQELVAAVADTAGLAKTDASAAVDAVFEVIVDAMKRGDDVRLVGFGTFNVVHREQSTGRNPRTGAEIVIKAAKLPRFKAGRALKDAIN